MTHILAVGSDLNMINTLEYILEAESFEVTRAAAAIDAKAIISKSHFPFHLLIVDTSSSGNSCRELISHVRTENTHIPVLLIVSHLEREKLKSSCHGKQVKCIEKPVDRATLLNAVKAALDKKDS
jgi:DNA-binding NtrC family response regulator